MQIMMSQEDSSYISRVFYEAKSLKNIIVYLINNINTIYNTEIYKSYEEKSINKEIELELIKDTLARKYLPKEYENYKYNYSFDFFTDTITYELINK